MALSPIELLAIAIIVILFLVWGPKKIPELARSLGRAKKEFNEGLEEASH